MNLFPHQVKVSLRLPAQDIIQNLLINQIKNSNEIVLVEFKKHSM